MSMRDTAIAKRVRAHCGRLLACVFFGGGLLSACAEPFGSPLTTDANHVAVLPDLSTVTDVSAVMDLATAAALRRADGGSAITAKPEPPSAKQARSDKDSDDEEEKDIVSESVLGDVLAIAEDETISVVPKARVRLVCRGSTTDQDGYSTTRCDSSLTLRTGTGKNAQQLAATDDVPGRDDFKADGGDKQTELSVDLLPLLDTPRAALIRVTEHAKGGESIVSSSSSTVHLYALRGTKLVEVLQYVADSSQFVDTDPPHDKTETREATLRIDKSKRTRGLPDLVLRVHESTTSGSRTKKTKSETRYVWNGTFYDTCEPTLDTVEHCGACGAACTPGQGCCGKRCMNLTTVEHCGACTVRCATVGTGTVPVCAEPSKRRCDYACAGDRYDVDDDPKNGCEVTHSAASGPDLDRGVRGCSDADSAEELRGELLSDARSHVQPVIAGFDVRTGSAKTTLRMQTSGGSLCQNDLRFTLRLDPSSAANTPAATTPVASTSEPRPCYRLTVRTDRGQRSIELASGTTGTIAHGHGAYTTGATILVTLEKICPLPMHEAVRYTLSYHL